jgi:hypothetical protein
MISKVHLENNQSTTNETCEWKLYRLGWTFVDSVVFIHDYVKGCNGGYTIPTNVWFAPTNANKICFAIFHRGTMGCKPNMGIDKSITWVGEIRILIRCIGEHSLSSME